MTFDSEYEPFFQPPSWIIGPIWMCLYVCLAISLTNTLSKRDELEYLNLIIISFLVQIIMIFTWPLVFNSEKYLASLGMILVMIIFTIIYAYFTYQVVPIASKLVWPYLLCISFAGIINLAYFLEAS